MSLLEKVNPLVEQHKFDDIESLWMAKMESDPGDVDDFLATAKAMRRAEERVRSTALMELLADALRDQGAWPERLRVLKEIGRLSKKPANLRAPIEEALKHVHGSGKSYKKAIVFAKFNDPASNPVEKADKVEQWLLYDEGETFFMGGRGVGQVIELNPELGVCRLDFEKDKRVSVPVGAAQKFLIPIPPGHLLRKKIDAPEELRKMARESPAGTFAELLQSFGRPMTMTEVRDAMTGVVPEDKWAGWWTTARKHPQVIVSGSGAKATYAWTSSTSHADDSIRKRFDAASLREKLELARKHSGRGSGQADYFAERLAEEAVKVSRTEPSLTWETFAILEKLPGKTTSLFDPDSLLLGPMAARTAVGVEDRALRERAWKVIREKHPEWPKILAEAFFREEDPRVLTSIMRFIDDGGQPEIRARLIDETLRYPSRHPKAFFWYCKTLSDTAEAMPERGGYSLLYQMLDAIGSDEFSSMRARMKEFFDKGGLAVRIIMKTDDEEQARKLLETLERFGQLEEYRRENLKAAALMKYNKLREPQVEPVYATAELLAAKRAELENLVKVEIPLNSKAIQVAREMGDLRENFEYKAARQRAEYLAARAGELQGELSRVRLLQPDQVDTSEIRIGTKSSLRNGDTHREVTILGPWESAPEQGVYSHQSDVAKALVGRKVGDIVSFMGNDYLVEAISKWQ
ncbi:MAG TPA: GreA/GreB family elongation factor [Thermoanaerobaculia bacterium]|nr:GreA/GreB family elongation factor [Thermoanaerobaculia bacterium]